MPRPTCPQCRTPLARCFCDLVVATHSEVEVIIWQHPSEAGHAKGTVPLLSRCLKNSQLIIAETLSLREFEQSVGSNCRQLSLLFPRSEADRTTLSDDSDAAASSLRLLVLDGTWRKARKLLYLNPWLHTLPRLELVDTPTSRYHIRKAENSQQLSTLEAVCAAIAQIEKSSKNSQPLLEAFDRYLTRLSLPYQKRPNSP